jgi:DNA-binding response OmpR family regulator
MKLLIVEDDVVLGRAIARMLMARGHRCRVASSVTSAVRSLATKRPDFLLTDYDLGAGCTGVDLAGWVRASFDIPVIVMTGHEAGAARAQLDDAGLADVRILPKPFSQDELAGKLIANDNGRRPPARRKRSGSRPIPGAGDPPLSSLPFAFGQAPAPPPD